MQKLDLRLDRCAILDYILALPAPGAGMVDHVKLGVSDLTACALGPDGHHIETVCHAEQIEFVQGKS